MGASALAMAGHVVSTTRVRSVDYLEAEIAGLKQLVRELSGADMTEQLRRVFGLTMSEAVISAVLMQRFPQNVSLPALCDVYEGREGGRPVSTKTVDSHLSRAGRRLMTQGAPSAFRAAQYGYRTVTREAAVWVAPRLDFHGIAGFAGLRALVAEPRARGV
jgi:hypothetical protein